MFNCSMYDDLRAVWMKSLSVPENFNEMSLTEKLKLVLNEAGNVRPTAKFMVSVMDIRSLKIKFNNAFLETNHTLLRFTCHFPSRNIL